MNANQYRAAIERLKLTQGEASALLGAGARTGRSWALGESKIPVAVAILLRLLVTRKVKISDVRKLSGGGPE